MSFFEERKINISEKKLGSLSRIHRNPILYKNSDNPELTIIIDKLIGKDLISKFHTKFIQQTKPDLKYQILYCFQYKPGPSDLKSNIHVYYNYNKINYFNYIPNFSKIITLGKTIYQTTEGSTDLKVESFYDFIFNKSYFFSPSLKSWVFPVDNFFEIINFDNFKSFFCLYQLKTAINFQSKAIRVKKLEYELVLDPNTFLLRNMDEKNVAIDIETSGLDFLTDRIGCITLAFNSEKAYYLRWDDIDKSILNQFLKNKYQILQNGKFDIKFLWKSGITNARLDYDTLNAGHILNEKRSNSLKAQSYYYTLFGGYDVELDSYKKKYKNLKNYLEIPENILFKYACMDAIITFQIYEKQLDQIQRIDNSFYPINCKWKLSDYFFKINIPAITIFAKMEYRGIYYDWNKLEIVSKKLQKEIINLKKEIELALNINSDACNNKKHSSFFSIVSINKKKEINIDSDEQLGIVFEEKGWENLGRSKKGNYLVNDITLNKWVKLGHSEASLIIKLHELNTLMKTFIGIKEKNNGFWQYKKIDNKLHPEYGVMRTSSHRNFCKSPNLQNQKQRGYLAKEIKANFITPSSDFLLADCDMSGFQLRIGCLLSGDKMMTKAFKELGGDLHSLTATNVFCRNMDIVSFLNKKNEEPYKTYRYKSKAVNFSLEFGSSAFSFARQSLEPEWSLEDCKKYIIDNNLNNSFYYSILTKKTKDNKEDNNIDNIDIYNSIENKEEFSYYWCVAADIRKKFFGNYAGLKIWIDKCIEEGKNQGYVISPFGGIRRLPELLYKGKDSLNSEYKNFCNIAINTRVQNFEVSVMLLSMIEIDRKFEELGLKSRIFNMVHDSIDFYVHKEEIELTKKIIKETLEQIREEYNNIPILAEGEISDPLNSNNPSYWGFGEYWF